VAQHDHKSLVTTSHLSVTKLSMTRAPSKLKSEEYTTQVHGRLNPRTWQFGKVGSETDVIKFLPMDKVGIIKSRDLVTEGDVSWRAQGPGSL